MALEPLKPAHRDTLGVDMEREEWQVIKDLKPRKRPGPGEFTVLFYKKLLDVAITHYSSLFNSIRQGETLPKTMLQASIVMLPKPDKDNQTWASFRPISLLSVDIKILPKVLATQLNHKDQVGFVPLRLWPIEA